MKENYFVMIRSIISDLTYSEAGGLTLRFRDNEIAKISSNRNGGDGLHQSGFFHFLKNELNRKVLYVTIVFAI